MFYISNFQTFIVLQLSPSTESQQLLTVLVWQPFHLQSRLNVRIHSYQEKVENDLHSLYHSTTFRVPLWPILDMIMSFEKRRLRVIESQQLLTALVWLHLHLQSCIGVQILSCQEKVKNNSFTTRWSFMAKQQKELYEINLVQIPNVPHLP
jgi:hypothetical protein